MKKIKKFNYKNLNIIKTIFFVFVISKLLILIFFQYPSPVGDSIYFLSVSKFHCTDGIFRTPLLPLDENGYRYLWHGIMQPFLISFLSYDCSIQSFYFAICLLIISTLFLVFFLKIKSYEKKFIWIFSIIIFSLQVKQGFRPEIISIFLILLIEYFFLKKNYLFTLPLVFLAWSHPAVFLIEIIFLSLRLDKELFIIFFKNLNKIFFTIILANILITYLYPFNVYDHINFLIKQAHLLNTKIPGDFYTYFIRSDFFPLFGVSFFFILVFLFHLNKKFLLLCLPIYYFGTRFPQTYYNLIPLYISIIYHINYILSEKLNYKKSLLLNLFKYYLLFVFFMSIIGLSQGLARDLFSKLNFNSSPQSTKKIYNDLIARNNEVCAIPVFFTLFLNFEELVEKNYILSKNCNKNKKNILNIYAVNGYNLNELKNNNCILSHKSNNILSFINPFKGESGYSVYICKER
jgi:hypothetical protein